jgi:hypothetical protein
MAAAKQNHGLVLSRNILCLDVIYHWGGQNMDFLESKGHIIVGLVLNKYLVEI